MIDGVRICLRCGRELPITCSQCRKYCDECAAERNRELTRERLERARQKAQIVRSEKQDAKDRAFCKKCIYHGSKDCMVNLCDYLIFTGHPRGCKAGYGCIRREIAEDGA